MFLRSTRFQVMVWKALLKIPSGTVVNYGEVVQHFGRPKNARAVGSARGTNRIGCLIPCHRGIHNTSTITGYRWGPDRKHDMLAWKVAREGVRAVT